MFLMIIMIKVMPCLSENDLLTIFYTASGGLVSSNTPKVFSLLDSTLEKFHKVVRGQCLSLGHVLKDFVCIIRYTHEKSHNL